MLLVIAVITLFFYFREDPDERYDTGYSDGYAAGYNTTCEIRATLIEGDWDSEPYSAGYNDGYHDGSIDCRESQRDAR